MWRIMEEKGIEEDLIDRIKEIYKETMVSIKTVEGISRSFCTEKGVRQGCALSPTLFNLYIADIDKLVLKERKIGGIKLGKDKIWTLAYADMVIVAKNRTVMLDMMDTLFF